MGVLTSILNGAISSAGEWLGKITGISPSASEMQLLQLTDKIRKAYGTSFDIDGMYNIEAFMIQNSSIGVIDLMSLLPQMNILISKIDIQDKRFADMHTYIGSKWYYSLGKSEMGLITFTFYDLNGGFLYSTFSTLIEMLKDLYPDDQKWTIKIKKRTINEYRNYINPMEQASYSSGINYVLNTNCAVMKQVGALSLDQDSNSLSKFLISFDYDPYPKQ